LRLTPQAGSPPLQVGTAVKVANLNADLLDGKDSSEFVPRAAFDALQADHAALAAQVAELGDRGITPGLAAVLVGDDEPSRIYVGAKQRASAEVGIRSERHELPGHAGEDELLDVIRRLNDDPTVHGILVQLPLPDHISVLGVHETISVDKDVDALTPNSVGRLVRGEAVYLPATPFGIVEMLERSGIETAGRDVVIVGRGALGGMPLAIMLAQKTPRGNATVTLCHTATTDLASHTRRADILVAAAGRPGTITADMVKPGAAVIDVAVNRTDAGLVGDVAFDEVAEVSGWITPVPGGVGPLTVAMLLVNTVTAAERAA
jgi:methylenetetrahydrofolate dehydrogenase (NADP+) / methenyltetrahydrofolate cyclohydrolase